MSVQVIVLNGGSSSSIARHLQALLPGVWLTLSTDTLVAALPASLRESGDGGRHHRHRGGVPPRGYRVESGRGASRPRRRARDRGRGVPGWRGLAGALAGSPGRPGGAVGGSPV
ncbi:phosphotransferase-like protein [Deinococcus radiotolerans]|uniref:phosphotransferase-like protein n=1 Tax=Deinococcus radiotolerans TaxID=1309407 RepID=UPI003570BB2B